MINFAHRGASSYYPENTFSAFYAGLFQGATGLETDVRQTKDGVLVLFHDKDLTRVAGVEGSIGDFTYRELRDINIYRSLDDKSNYDRIASLEDFLKQFHFRDLVFAIELKDEHIEAQVLAMLNKYNMAGKTVVTSFEYGNLRRARSIDPSIRLGYLAKELNSETVPMLEEIRAYQICPKAEILTRELTGQYRKLGYNVRAWGVKTEELMHRMIDTGVDGMTVNFPDVLTRALKTKETQGRG